MQRFFSLGLIRGLIATPVGVGIGMGFTMLVRILMGLPAWEPAPVSFTGAVFGVIAFLAGVGAFSDWLSWARGQQAGTPPHPSADVPAWTRYFCFDPGHKIIGVQYVVTAILVLFLAGWMALLIRMELLQPAMQYLTLDSYNSVMGIHGIIMIASILVGIAGMANYLVPLLVGAEDMVFPRLNALSFWLIPPAATLVLLSLFTGGFDTGWTGYPPLGVRSPLGAQFFYSGVFVLGLSSILGSINFILTILKLRAPGMSLFRMPILAWTILAASIIQLIATAFMMVVAERLIGVGFSCYDRRTKMRKAILLLLTVMLSACGIRSPADPQIRAENVWSRPAVAMPGGDTEMGHGTGGTGAIFMTLVNDSQEDDHLISAQTDVAEKVEIHQTTMEGDVMKMQQVTAIEVASGERVKLEPGGYHIMLIDLYHDLAEGDRFSVTLTFEKSGVLTVEAQVRQP